MKSLSQAPIGIFDSGIGGLTVAKAVIEALPGEDIIYFGDTARVPYGIKSEETVRNYAVQITRFLMDKGVKMILIACNTVSASAKKEIEEIAGIIPVIDVITAGSEIAVQKAGDNSTHVGVIGTLATVHSGAYPKTIHVLNKDLNVTQKACPLLVPLAEEGWTDNEIAIKTIETYLSDFKRSDISSLILGCTHYPLFKDTIKKYLTGKNIEIIDSAESIAQTAKTELKERNLQNSSGGSFSCFVSDQPQRFQELAERFLGRRIDDVQIERLS